MSEQPIEEQLADLVNQPGGIDRLDSALRPHGFTLAAYFTPHDEHVLELARYSNCEECVGDLARSSPQ